MSDSKKKTEVVPAFDYENAKELLKVKHLKQYFRFKNAGSKYLKAVHDVSFTVYKGEVFGLVGESGCGKTTTGRDILKLYKITSGDIWLDGVRIAAGTRWNEKEIKFTNIRLRKYLKEFPKKKATAIAALAESYANEFDEDFNPSRLASLKASDKDNDNDVSIIQSKKAYLERYEKLLADLEKEREERIQNAKEISKTQREKIIQARKDDKDYAKRISEIAVKEYIESHKEEMDVIQSYEEKLGKETDERKREFLETWIEDKKKAYDEGLAKAKATSLPNKVQMIFQDPIASLDPRMTVRSIISEGLVIQGVHDQKYINDEVSRVLKLVGLVPEHANRYPHEFSGGQRQRIGIARAIIMKPELIVADEPVSALDVSIQAQVINLLNDLRKNLGLTIIFIAHNLSVVKYFCDRIAVMYFGNLVELATSDELFAHPLHPYTKSLLSAVPYPDPNIESERKRILYNPAQAHDYSKQKPTMRELEKGHFVLCNDEEEERYRKELLEQKSVYAK